MLGCELHSTARGRELESRELTQEWELGDPVGSCCLREGELQAMPLEANRLSFV